MKKVHYALVTVFFISIAAFLVISPSKAVSQKKISQSGYSIPDNVMGIFRNSCIGCHGEGGNGMAMSMLNFSTWDTYSVKKQAKKASAICNEITKGAMPPASVRDANPGKIPTAAQLEIVCKWANSLNGK
jgi:hypothetical protein